MARLWDAATGKLLGSPLQHQQTVMAVAFGPDGQTAVTGSVDGTARLWDTATGKPLGPPLTHQAPVEAVAFCPNGRTILTGSDDKTARLWQVPIPVEGEVERIVLWTQVLTGMELDDDGVDRVLDAEAWQERCRRLEQLGGPPTSAEGVLPRVRREAADCEHQRQWFAAVFHLSRLIDLEPNDGSLRARRGRARAELGTWDQAAADYAQALGLGVDTAAVWIGHAHLRWALGDLDGYRQNCIRMLERFGETASAADANNVAWTCVLTAGAVADWALVRQLAQKAVAESPKSYVYLRTLGAVHYRAGEFDTAVKRLNEAIQVHGKGGTAAGWLFLAMAHYRLGQSDEARRWLDKAVRSIDQLTGDKPQGAELPWAQRLEFRLLRREAEALLKVATPAPPE
jgi:tetratricopeptide (TPR) repeat protein